MTDQPQCYRTWPHADHETTEGRCPGLEGTPAALVSLRQLLVSQVEEALDQAQSYGESKGQADTLAALRRAATDPVTSPMTRLGISLSGVMDTPQTEDAPLAREGLRIPGPDRPATDPWTEKPSYLMLELALRKVRDDLASGSYGHGPAVVYIDRVLANDLTDPEEPTEWETPGDGLGDAFYDHGNSRGNPELGHTTSGGYVYGITRMRYEECDHYECAEVTVTPGKPTDA